MASNKNKPVENNDVVIENKCEARSRICGIIRPIASMHPVEYSDSHWNEVHEVIKRAVKLAGFEPRTVSDSDHANLIHGSIINNLYDDEIVICDVSNKNANVMFELGIRLAFDKPVIIITDDKTGYSFDINGMKHFEYPFDLQFNKTQKFIDDLADNIKSTCEASRNGTYTSFLSQYKKVHVESKIIAQNIETESIDIGTALNGMMKEMSSMRSQIKNINNTGSVAHETENVELQRCVQIVAHNSIIDDLHNWVATFSRGRVHVNYIDQIAIGVNGDSDLCLFDINLSTHILSREPFYRFMGTLQRKWSVIPVDDDVIKSILTNHSSTIHE